jgi:hypothetical protein
MCPFQYYLEYQLGLKGRPNPRTEKGSIVHKALELLAHRKLAEQEGRAEFEESELGLTVRAADVDVRSSVDLAWAHYTARNESRHDWSRADHDDCLRWTLDVVEHGGGMFNPLNRKIVCPERYFDLTIEEPWSWFDYQDPFTGERVAGHLSVKGTMDLITEAAPDVLENLDWKSGRQWDWANDKPKDFESLCDDPQLLLYFYALCRLYPEYRFKFVTIYFAQTKSPFTIPFDEGRDVPRALAMLRERFERVKNDWNPRRIMENPDKKWKCRAFCPQGTRDFGGNKVPAGRAVCDVVHRDVVQLGLEKAMKKHGKPSVYSTYGSGGGLTNRETA